MGFSRLYCLSDCSWFGCRCCDDRGSWVVWVVRFCCSQSRFPWSHMSTRRVRWCIAHMKMHTQGFTTNNEQHYIPTSGSRQCHLKRRTTQRDPLNTLLFNSLLQNIKKQPSVKVRDNHGVSIAEHDRDAYLPHLRFARDILLISGSLKHATTVLDDLTTATTAHGLQLHPTNTKNITVAVQMESIEILPPEKKTKHLCQLITFKNAVQVEFDHRIKCAWATFTSHRQELTSPKYPLRATVTPSLLYASRT